MEIFLILFGIITLIVIIRTIKYGKSTTNQNGSRGGPLNDDTDTQRK